MSKAGFSHAGPLIRRGEASGHRLCYIRSGFPLRDMGYVYHYCVCRVSVRKALSVVTVRCYVVLGVRLSCGKTNRPVFKYYVIKSEILQLMHDYIKQCITLILNMNES